MYLRMKRHASRSDSASHQFLMRVPADVAKLVEGRVLDVELPAGTLDARTVVHMKLGKFAKVSLRTRDAETADIRRLAVTSALSQFYASVRSGTVTLSQKQTVAFAGEVYRLLRQTHDENPGTPEEWEAWKGFTRAALEGRLWEAPKLPNGPRNEEQAAALAIFGNDLTVGIDALPRAYDETALEQRCGRLALWVLRRHEIEIDRASHLALLREVAKAALQAGWQLKRQAGGDYRPDPLEGRFPAVPSISTRDITFDVLFDRWQAETKPAASTVTTWRGIIAALAKHAGHDDPSLVTPDHVVRWKDTLVASGRSLKTINDSDLACIRALYRYGVKNKVLTTNPAEGIAVKVRRRAGSRMLPYDDGEVARLLDIASRETSPARHWLPWLAALTGARIGELAQAWGSQVREVDGVPVLEIKPAPDGGSLKNEGSERVVPLHPALVEAGFLDFARQCGDRPMFYGRPAKPGAKGRHPSKGVTNHLASWIREQGFTDLRKAPSHALRHWFKSTASRVGIADSIADALQGHADASTAATYRHVDVQSLASAVATVPVPKLSGKDSKADAGASSAS